MGKKEGDFIPKDLLKVVEKGNVKKMKKYLEKEAKIDQIYDAKRNLLHIAACKGNVAMLEVLLGSKQFNINARDKDGYTPLFLSVFERQEEAIFFLLRQGGNPDVKSYSNEKLWDKANVLLKRSTMSKLKSEYALLKAKNREHFAVPKSPQPAPQPAPKRVQIDDLMEDTIEEGKVEEEKEEEEVEVEEESRLQLDELTESITAFSRAVLSRQIGEDDIKEIGATLTFVMTSVKNAQSSIDGYMADIEEEEIREEILQLLDQLSASLRGVAGCIRSLHEDSQDKVAYKSLVNIARTLCTTSYAFFVACVASHIHTQLGGALDQCALSTRGFIASSLGKDDTTPYITSYHTYVNDITRLYRMAHTWILLGDPSLPRLQKVNYAMEDLVRCAEGLLLVGKGVYYAPKVYGARKDITVLAQRMAGNYHSLTTVIIDEEEVNPSRELVIDHQVNFAKIQVEIEEVLLQLAHRCKEYDIDRDRQFVDIFTALSADIREVQVAMRDFAPHSLLTSCLMIANKASSVASILFTTASTHPDAIIATHISAALENILYFSMSFKLACSAEALSIAPSLPYIGQAVTIALRGLISTLTLLLEAKLY